MVFRVRHGRPTHSKHCYYGWGGRLPQLPSPLSLFKKSAFRAIASGEEKKKTTHSPSRCRKLNGRRKVVDSYHGDSIVNCCCTLYVIALVASKSLAVSSVSWRPSWSRRWPGENPFVDSVGKSGWVKTCRYEPCCAYQRC